MTDQDVMVAAPPDSDEGRPEQSLVEQLVEQARADGIGLVGPGGLLAGLTKQILEAGLEVDEHLGYAKHAAEAVTAATLATVPGRRGCSPRSARSTSTCRGIVTAASSRRRYVKVSAGWVGSTRWSSRSPPKG